MATNLELCIKLQNDIDGGISRIYEDWRSGISKIRNIVILYILIFAVATLLSAFSILRETSIESLISNINLEMLVAIALLLLLTKFFFKIFRPIPTLLKDSMYVFAMRILAVKSFIIIELYLIYSIFITHHLLVAQNVNILLFSLLTLNILTFFILFTILTITLRLSKRNIFIVFTEIRDSQDVNIPSVESIHMTLSDELNEILKPIASIQLEHVLELLHQRRESRMHSVSIVSLIMTVAALAGIIVSMGASAFTIGDKLLSLFSMVDQSTTGMTSILVTSMVVLLFGGGMVFGAATYYRAFVSSSTQIVIRAHLQQRQLEIIEKNNLLKTLVLP